MVRAGCESTGQHVAAALVFGFSEAALLEVIEGAEERKAPKVSFG